jgi:hypothetical protein
VVTDVVESQLPQQGEVNDMVIDTAIYRIQGKRGELLTVDFRVDHNGYYGGWPELCDWPENDQDNDIELVCIAPSEE